MAKTALQQAIDLIGNLMSKTDTTSGNFVGLAASQYVLTDLLPTERQQIEDAYNAGSENKVFTEGLEGEFYDINAAEYYYKKFNNK